VQAFDLATQQLTGQIFMPEFGGGGPPEMYRWGSNDLEVGVMNAMLFLRTSLTNSTAPAAQFYVSAISPEDVPAGNPDLAVTIQGSGFSVSDSVTANGVALHITSATANQIAATIPASLLSAAGDVPIAISDATNHVGYLDLVVSPQPTQVGLSTKALTFAAQNVGTSSTAQTVILTDTGTTPLSVSSVSIIGDFSQTNNCATLAPAGTCAISVIFAPSAAGTRSGTLQIDDSDASKSQTVTLAGMGSDVQISGSGGANLTATAAPGQSATYSLSITPEGTFTGPLTFSCSNLPAFASCGFNPASAMIGSSAVSVTVTISTVQQSATVIHPTLRPPGLLACLSALFLLSFGQFEQLGKLQRRATVALLIIMLVALPVAGCGGGGSSSTVPLKPASTPAGTYTITFTATDGAFSRSVQLNLVVTN
jgi:hypothetical protein